MAINQLSTANTFQEWLTATSALVAVANNLTDHQPGQIFAANTILDIATAGTKNKAAGENFLGGDPAKGPWDFSPIAKAYNLGTDTFGSFQWPWKKDH